MKFVIRLYEPFKRVVFYTVHLDGEEYCETDRFISRFLNSRFSSDLAELKKFIQKMGENGAWPQRFRDEDNAHALPNTRNNLRLYCIRCTNETVILCGGGRKTSFPVQDSPDAFPHFKLVKKIETLFTERIQDGSIYYNGKFLQGKLDFDTENFD